MTRKEALAQAIKVAKANDRVQIVARSLHEDDWYTVSFDRKHTIPQPQAVPMRYVLPDGTVTGLAN